MDVRNMNPKKVVLALLAVVVVYVIYKNYVSEPFAETKSVIKPKKQVLSVQPYDPVNPTELVESDREIVINPPYVNPDTRTIMAGSGFIPQAEIIPAWGNNYGLTDDLDDGEGGNMGFHYNLCSPSCCSAQYPTPHKLEKDPLICGREDEFKSTNYFCSNSWQNSGCLCATNKQVDFLTNRGGNAN
jgi:hypothetical protein